MVLSGSQQSWAGAERADPDLWVRLFHPQEGGTLAPEGDCCEGAPYLGSLTPVLLGTKWVYSFFKEDKPEQ